MTDVVANSLQWERGIDKALHTGMSERVRTRLSHGHTGLAQVMACPPRHRSVCEGDMLREAGRYERTQARRDTRAGSYRRKLGTQARRSRAQDTEVAPADFRDRDHRALPAAGELGRRALIEMYLAGVSVRRVEDITEALWGTRVSPTTVSNLNKKIYATIESWRNRPIEGEHPYVYLDGIVLKRTWVGEVTLARLGIRGFNPKLKKAAESLEELRSESPASFVGIRMEELRTPEGEPIPPNTLAELCREMARRRLVMDQIQQLEAVRLERLKQAPKAGPNATILLLARVIGIGIETADMLVQEVLSRNMRDRRAVARYSGLQGSSTTAESRPSRIGPITLDAKQTGERSAQPGSTTWHWAGRERRLDRSVCIDHRERHADGKLPGARRLQPSSPCLLPVILKLEKLSSLPACGRDRKWRGEVNTCSIAQFPAL
jgi:hypothetical protein